MVLTLWSDRLTSTDELFRFRSKRTPLNCHEGKTDVRVNPEVERAVLVAPYIPHCDPFGADECKECINDDHAKGDAENSLALGLSLTGIHSYFSEEEWNERNPIEFARRGEFSNWKRRIMIVWVEKDDLGFNRTSRILAETAGFEPLPGDWSHRMPDNEHDLMRMADFLESR